MSPPPHLFSTAALLAVLFLLAAEATVARSNFEASWQPFRNLKARKVTAVAQFSVKEYNKAYPDRPPLSLVSVDKGEFLKAVGANYHLYITAAAGRLGRGKYQTFVFEYRTGKWELTSFVRMDRG
ncbi:unnamed protein product [Linum trigynum]|uniref:Cystatin domain-containing protein n=1 Tax=Linum trigynum TaxID=586398 RepID=A0AAV2C7G8_9ROSI